LKFSRLPKVRWFWIDEGFRFRHKIYVIKIAGNGRRSVLSCSDCERKRLKQPNPVYSYAGGSFHGWNGSITGNVNKWFGVTADFSGHYGGSIDEDGFDEKQRVHSYLFGPRVAARKKRVMAFAHALFGVSTLRTELTGFGQRFVFSDTGFGLVLGGGFTSILPPAVGGISGFETVSFVLPLFCVNVGLRISPIWATK